MNQNLTVKFDGVWEKGEPHQGTRYYGDGRNYTGFFQNLMHNGKGKISYLNGTTIEGNFFNGQPEGHITYTYPNGDIRNGVFNKVSNQSMHKNRTLNLRMTLKVVQKVGFSQTHIIALFEI